MLLSSQFVCSQIVNSNSSLISRLTCGVHKRYLIYLQLAQNVHIPNLYVVVFELYNIYVHSRVVHASSKIRVRVKIEWEGR